MVHMHLDRVAVEFIAKTIQGGLQPRLGQDLRARLDQRLQQPELLHAQRHRRARLGDGTGRGINRDIAVVQQCAGAAGTAPLVRVPWKDPAQIMRALDSGASGVVVPMIASAAEAREAVSACRFPPTGIRSWGPMWGYVRSDGALPPAEQDAGVLCIVMIETAEAIEQLDAILETEGIDGVYIGPNDLALACGFGRGTYRDDPKVAALIQNIVDTCRAAGVPAGLHCSDPEMGRDWIARGATMVTIAWDVGLIADGALEALRQARGDGGEASQGTARPY